MAQQDEPLTDEAVAQEILTAIEAMAEDGGSELGAFKVRASPNDPRRIIIRTSDKKQFLVTVKEV